MANRYANLVGSNKIKDEWQKINTGFDLVQADMDAKPDSSIAQVNDIELDADDTLTIEGGTGIEVTTIPAEKKVRLVATGTSTPGPHAIEHITGGTDVIPDATTSSSGLMSAADKAALENMKRINVKDYGAKGDGVTDDTAAIQAAIDAANTAGGGIVYFPTGRYAVRSTIHVKPRVLLLGNFKIQDRTANSTAIGSTVAPQLINYNTVFLCYGGDSPSTSAQFIMDYYSGISGFVFQYPDQVSYTESTPVQYGYTIATDTSQDYNIDGVYLENLMLYNSYQGISLDKAGQFILQNIYGDCYKTGLYIDRSKDVGRISHVHFWTFSRGQAGNPLFEWVKANGRAYHIRECDGMTAHDLFCYGYYEGVVFDEGVSAGQYPWATITGMIIDETQFPITVNKANTIQIIGGQCSVGDRKNVAVKTSDDIKGSFIMDSYAFFGAPNVTAHIKSNSGNIVFNGCDFGFVFGGTGNNTGYLFAPIISEGNAFVYINSCPGLKDNRMLPFGGGNVFVDGVRMPSLDTNVSPPNFDMATFTGNVPDNWTAPNGSTRFSQITGGINISLDGSLTSPQTLDYSIPANQRAKGYFIVELEYEVVNASGDWKVDFRTCASDGSNVTTLYQARDNRSIDLYTKVKVRLPFYTGFATSTHVFRITVQTFSPATSGDFKITNIKMYEANTSNLSDETLELLCRTIYRDPYVMGRRYFVEGTRQIFHYTGAPTFGTWNVGDEVKNITPVPSGYAGYICTAAGSPGTWKGFGQIQA
jgi:hypothetical protein